MKDDTKSLQTAINAIKRLGEIQGTPISETEIAKEMNISNEKLADYINAKEKLPQGSVEKLLSSYGIKHKVVSTLERRFIKDPPSSTER
jgi:hypothetical protein